MNRWPQLTLTDREALSVFEPGWQEDVNAFYVIAEQLRSSDPDLILSEQASRFLLGSETTR